MRDEAERIRLLKANVVLYARRFAHGYATADELRAQVKALEIALAASRPGPLHPDELQPKGAA